MSCGCVVGTINTTIWLPKVVSISASCAVSCWVCSADSVPVWSITRPSSAGTGSTLAAAIKGTPIKAPETKANQHTTKQWRKAHNALTMCVVTRALIGWHQSQQWAAWKFQPRFEQ